MDLVAGKIPTCEDCLTCVNVDTFASKLLLCKQPKNNLGFGIGNIFDKMNDAKLILTPDLTQGYHHMHFCVEVKRTSFETHNKTYNDVYYLWDLKLICCEYSEDQCEYYLKSMTLWCILRHYQGIFGTKIRI